LNQQDQAVEEVNTSSTAQERGLKAALLAPDHLLTRWLFLRGLALIYLVAFVSLWVQIEGLLGSWGILPIADFLAAVRQQTGPERYWLLPTLFWLNTSDAFLQGLCGLGVVLAVLLMIGILPGPLLCVLWLFYLSLITAGQEFLGFQWDNLLLEAGFLAIFFTPWQLWSRLRQEAPPSRIILWLFYWLLFRLMFSSGLVKLLSGDLAWRGLTALNYHYETQPLPTWTSWYIHQLPVLFQKASVVYMFVVELLAPFLIFAPRRWRLLGCALLVSLQLLIIATGNYGFFNWLSLLLCLLLLDDTFFRRWWPERWRSQLGVEQAHPRFTSPLGRYRSYAGLVLALLIVMITGLQMARLVWPLPRPARQLLSWAAPFRTFNNYGLFAVMTTSRPEIIIEGSNDGETWQAYEFKWKPGDIGYRPRFVAPHQPRLDWQMWFAALSNYQNNPWLVNFMVRLLEGSPPVLALLKENPFPDAPPHYIRAVVYNYHFTRYGTREESGAWWQRELKGLYIPVFSLTGK
jgi:lipase maturation factor 1